MRVKGRERRAFLSYYRCRDVTEERETAAGRFENSERISIQKANIKFDGW